MSGRPISECLAHQSEAPAGWQRRRDVPLQCPLTKVAGGVGGGRVRARGAILGERSSRTVESTSTRRKSSLFAERRRKQVSAGSCAMNGVSSPFVTSSPVTRVLGSSDEEGSSHSCEAFTHELSTRAPRLRSRRAWLFALLIREQRIRGRDRGPFLGRGSNARLSVLACRKRCRSRQAASGSEKRGIDPFLTEHRFPWTGPSEHARAEVAERHRGERVRAKKRRAPDRDGKVTRSANVELSHPRSETINRAA